MIIWFILGVIGVILGAVGSAFGLLFSLVGSAVTAVFIVMLIVGAILFSPIFLWLALGLAAVGMFRGMRWLREDYANTSTNRALRAYPTNRLTPLVPDKYTIFN